MATDFDHRGQWTKAELENLLLKGSMRAHITGRSTTGSRAIALRLLQRLWCELNVVRGQRFENTMKTGFVHHELYLWHDTGTAGLWLTVPGVIQPEGHAEHPETKRRLRNLLDVSGVSDRLIAMPPRKASESDVLRYHTLGYIEDIKRMSDRSGGEAGEETPFGPGSYEIALLAVGGAIRAADAVLGGKVQNAYALVRPPGHHAESDRGRGFCIFGNVAISILHAMATWGVERVAVVDWDVHHGNGTQNAFYEDARVLTVSIHQDRSFPRDSGELAEQGEANGHGYNINIPLPPGSGHAAYIYAFERVVAPALRAHDPDVIFVSCGYDASFYDPLGRMLLSSESFRKMLQIVKEVAADTCDGRLVVCHEGGYSTAYVPFCGLAVMEELVEWRSGVEDPYLSAIRSIGGQELYPHQKVVVDGAAELVDRIR